MRRTFILTWVYLTLYFSPANAQIDNRLLQAIRNCDQSSLQKIIDSVPSINSTDSNRATILMWAAYYCDLPVVRYLVQHQAKVRDSAAIFINRGTSFYGNIQAIAACKRTPALLQYLSDSLHLAIDEKGYNPYTQQKDSWTPLFWAVANGSLDNVKYLLQKGAVIDVLDAEGCCTPLILAAEEEQWSIFQLLMEAGDQEKFGKHVNVFKASAARLAGQYPNKGYVTKEPEFRKFIVELKKAYFGTSHFSYAKSLNLLADAYLHMGEAGKAMPLYELAHEILKKVKHPEFAHSLNGLSDVYVYRGEYQKALPLMQQAVITRKEVLGEQNPDYAISLHNLAFLFEHIGQYDKALPLYEQTLEILQTVLGEKHSRYMPTLENLTGLYGRMGLYDKALPLLVKATEIQRAVWGGQHPHYASSLNNLANLYQSVGQFDKALSLLLQTVAIRKDWMRDHPDYATSLNDLAILYERIGQVEKSIPLLQEALGILKKILGERHSKYILTLENLAALYNNLGRSDTALLLYEQALAVRKAIVKDSPDYTLGLNSLASLYINKGEYIKALSLLEQAVIIRKKIWGEGHPDYAQSLYNLAKLYECLGRQEEAFSMYQKALKIREKALGVYHPDYGSSLNSLGLLYNIMGHPSEALDFLSKANATKVSQLTQSYASLSEQDKLAFLNKEAYQFHYLPSILYSQSNANQSALSQLYANELVAKGMVLEDQRQVLHSIRKSGDSAALRLFNLWRIHKVFIGKQLLLPVSQRVPYLDELQETNNQMEQQLSRLAIPFRNHLFYQQADVKKIRQKLGKGEAAIEFIRFNLYHQQWTDSILYAAIILLPLDSNLHFVSLFEERQLKRFLEPDTATSEQALGEGNEALIQHIYRGIIISENEQVGTVSDSLYQIIWKPLEPYLKNVHTVYYAPAGLLHRVAFQALRLDSTHLLIDQYQLNQLLSTRSLVFSEAVNSKPAIINIWGHIAYSLPPDSLQIQPGTDTSAFSFNFYTSDTRVSRGGTEWNNLPGTQQEMDSLQKILVHAGIQTETVGGAKATEEAFKRLDGQSPQVLHLATHGFFLPVGHQRVKEAIWEPGNVFTIQQNPMFRSGLVLAGANYAWRGGSSHPGREDGILTAYEITQLDFSSTELVVLSACETALGDLQGNEGVIGLQRAFKLAGVKQMILSLWRVSDKETMELMTLFYKNWTSGQSTREALRAAQLKMKEKYAPYYWAGFVLVE